MKLIASQNSKKSLNVIVLVCMFQESRKLEYVGVCFVARLQWYKKLNQEVYLFNFQTVKLGKNSRGIFGIY